MASMHALRGWQAHGGCRQWEHTCRGRLEADQPPSCLATRPDANPPRRAGSAITGPVAKECADLWPRVAAAANTIV